VNTPLPLSVGVDESRIIEIGVKGVSPGAGILRIDIVYYDGAEERNVTLCIPVIVEEGKICSLIQEY